MSTTDELLRNAESYAASFEKGDLPLPPGRRVAIVACMDARLNPYALLGLSEGDAHVIRNAGGRASDLRMTCACPDPSTKSVDTDFGRPRASAATASAPAPWRRPRCSTAPSPSAAVTRAGPTSFAIMAGHDGRRVRKYGYG